MPQALALVYLRGSSPLRPQALALVYLWGSSPSHPKCWHTLAQSGISCIHTVLSSSWWRTNWTSPIERLYLRYRLSVYDSYREVQVDRRLYELRELTSHKEHVVGSNIKHTYEVSPSAVRIQVYFACASHSVLNLHSTCTPVPEVASCTPPWKVTWTALSS